jgi:sugar phosphate isomerase/epimerase
MTTRRDFLQAAGAAAAGQALPPFAAQGFAGTLCFFSKHLPGMGPRRLAREVKRLGFGGIDLTVRAGGHINPERAADELPPAFNAIRAEGLLLPMITTSLLSASEPAARPILATAGRLGIAYCKPGYYKYDFKDVRSELARAGSQLTSLVELAREGGIQLGYHNHEGYIGAPVWDVAHIIDQLDPKWAGYYFDVRHAVAEGGVAAWKIAMRLVASRIKMIAVKDFYWERTPRGWRVHDCPLGEGMVDWKTYFSMLREARFQGPISLHLEYEINGASAAAKEEATLAAAARDLSFLKARIDEAYHA